MAKSRIEREKAKHRKGLMKRLERSNLPRKTQENQNSFKRQIDALARRMGFKH